MAAMEALMMTAGIQEDPAQPPVSKGGRSPPRNSVFLSQSQVAAAAAAAAAKLLTPDRSLRALAWPLLQLFLRRGWGRVIRVPPRPDTTNLRRPQRRRACLLKREIQI